MSIVEVGWFNEGAASTLASTQPSSREECSRLWSHMEDAAEVRARVWEWQSFQGLTLVFCLCVALPTLLVLTWVHLTLFLLVVELLEATLLALALGLVLGLAQIPRSISLTGGTVSLTFHWLHGRPRTLELQPEELGHLKILSLGWFGSSLIGQAGLRAGRVWWNTILSKQQAQLFEGRVRRMSWLHG